MRNRLIAMGPSRALDQFGNSNWLERLGGRHPEFGDATRRRRAWWFDTSRLPLEELWRLSGSWPRLVLLLEFDAEDSREIGLVKCNGGRMDVCHFHF